MQEEAFTIHRDKTVTTHRKDDYIDCHVPLLCPWSINRIEPSEGSQKTLIRSFEIGDGHEYASLEVDHDAEDVSQIQRQCTSGPAKPILEQFVDLTRRCIQVEELRCGIGEHQDMFVLKCQIFTAYMQSGFKLQQSRLAYGEQSDHSEDPQQ